MKNDDKNQPVKNQTIANNDQVKKLEEELNKTKAMAEEFRNKYLRALADYQNHEKRTHEEKQELVKTANVHLIIQLLPFLDNLEKAEVFIKDQGLKMIRDNYQKVLKEIGLEEIQVQGKEFDPYLAEAVGIVPGDKDNIVVEVTRKGYRYNGKILRVALVKVSKKVN